MKVLDIEITHMHKMQISSARLPTLHQIQVIDSHNDFDLVDKPFLRFYA